VDEIPSPEVRLACPVFRGRCSAVRRAGIEWGGFLTTESAPGRDKDGSRRPEIDWIKAVALVTVVFIHSLPPFFAQRVTPAELWLGELARFAVPGFLFASGFLYASSGSRDGSSTMGRRLKRLLVPYVLFSVLAQFHPVEAPTDFSFVENLLSGAALGEYYYIFVIFWMILVVPLVERIPRAAFPGVVLVALFLQWGLETGFLVTLTPFWSIRNPVRWVATFLMGWWVFENRVSIQRAVGAHRAVYLGLLIAIWVGFAIGLWVVPPGLARATLAWLQIYASLGILFATRVGTGSAPRLVRWLSDVSYSVYLSHLFFVDPVLQAIPRTVGAGWIALRLGAAWLAGLAGGAAVAIAARFVLGERRARAWFG